MRLKLARGSTVIRRHYLRISAQQSDRFLPANRSWGNVARLQTAASSRITTSPPRVLRRRSSKGGFGGCGNAASPEAEWRQRADSGGQANSPRRGDCRAAAGRPEPFRPTHASAASQGRSVAMPSRTAHTGPSSLAQRRAGLSPKLPSSPSPAEQPK